MPQICDTCTADICFAPSRLKECKEAVYAYDEEGWITECSAYIEVNPDMPMGVDACDVCKYQEVTVDPYDTGDNWLKEYECGAATLDNPEDGHYCTEWEEK